MEDKNWMYLLFALLILCCALAGFLARSREDSYKKKYGELKKSHVELARKQSLVLEKMMLNRDELKKYVPDYANLADDALDKAVRKEIGALEARIEELEKEK